ncbi:MAG: hypothetical protein JSR09_00855 [Bacteroidetes bacterium]|nr:hypothetical protein [Bacteroidota bacterium]MBS1648228.1 hypothetical protein [Bacteroidota bacterium]
MKKITVLICTCIIISSALAQRNIPPTYTAPVPEKKGFDINKMFIGGSLALGFSSYSFNIGGTPEIGYSLTNWLDAGLAINLNYNSMRADPYYNNNIRQRSFNYGGGPFVRIYPMPFLFLQGQLETNWIKYNYLNLNNNQSSSLTTNSNSILAGIGYTQRIVGQSGFYTAVLIDLNTDIYSPYRDYNNAALPIFRAGFTFYLHERKK